MKIDATEYGSITVNGASYPYDIVIRLSGEVLKRKKRFSKKYYNTSHIISREEAEFIFEKGCETLVLGAGQFKNLELSPEAEAYFRHHECRIILRPTTDAVVAYNKARGKTIGLFHVTC